MSGESARLASETSVEKRAESSVIFIAVLVPCKWCTTRHASRPHRRVQSQSRSARLQGSVPQPKHRRSVGSTCHARYRVTRCSLLQLAFASQSPGPAGRAFSLWLSFPSRLNERAGPYDQRPRAAGADFPIRPPLPFSEKRAGKGATRNRVVRTKSVNRSGLKIVDI